MARVLVIDDSPDNCRLLVRLFRGRGHEASFETSGPLGLSRLRAFRMDLVILDLMMPEIDGIEVLRAIRADPRTCRLPVILFTALSDRKHRDLAVASGANGYLVKGSLDVNALLAAVEHHLTAGGVDV